MGLIAQRLKDLGIVLPDPMPPIASYVNGVIADGLLFVSGKGPLEADKTFRTGKVGGTVTTAEAYQHARLTGLHLLAAIRSNSAISTGSTASSGFSAWSTPCPIIPNTRR